MPWLEPVVAVPLRAVAVGADMVGATRVGQYALSGLYNMAYYCAMAAELNGAQEFRRLVVGAGAPPLDRRPAAR
jgi:hypothetical protein